MRLYKTYTDDRIEKLKKYTKTKNQYSPKIIDGFKFLKFNKKIKITDENITKYNITNNKYVYTLGVEDDHSYSIGGIIAKNCFLIGTEDSIAGIYKTISDCAKISKWAGGIGLHVSNIRGKNALIRGTNGKSTGIIPMLKVYNETLKYVNQGGKRAGSAAIYLEPHHPDIMAFLELRKNHGNEEDRARDLFLALWASDLFMKRVKNDDIWSLFDPDTCPELTDLYGDEFEAKYIEYEQKRNMLTN